MCVLVIQHSFGCELSLTFADTPCIKNKKLKTPDKLSGARLGAFARLNKFSSLVHKNLSHKLQFACLLAVQQQAHLSHTYTPRERETNISQ